MYGTMRQTKCFAAYFDYGPKVEQPVLVEDPKTAKETVSSFAHGLWRESDKQIYMKKEAMISQVIRVYSSGRCALDDQPDLENIAAFCKDLGYEPVIHVYSMIADSMDIHEPSRFFAPYREDREVYWLLGYPYRCTRLDYRWRKLGVYKRPTTKYGIIDEVAFAKGTFERTRNTDGAQDLADFISGRYGLSEDDSAELLAMIEQQTVEGFLRADDAGRETFRIWIDARKTKDEAPVRSDSFHYSRRLYTRRLRMS